jgi:hypothetical protein
MIIFVKRGKKTQEGTHRNVERSRGLSDDLEKKKKEEKKRKKKMERNAKIAWKRRRFRLLVRGGDWADGWGSYVPKATNPAAALPHTRPKSLSIYEMHAHWQRLA